MPNINEMPKPFCNICSEWHEPESACEECGRACGHFYGCSDYAYCPQEPEE